MLKKIYNTVFIIAFLAVLAVPLLLTDFSSGGISQDENRVLAEFPTAIKDGTWNENFTGEFETWFMDHLGLRQELITANATLQFRVFGRMLDKSNYHIGKNGDINYATEYMLVDYAHINLRTPQEVAQIGQSYQKLSDYLAAKGIPFYYVQCYDKHTIYPEQFVDTVRQIGDISKTDQVIAYLQDHTSVKTISLKQPLLEAKQTYEVFSNWGDPTHWSERGALVGYRYIMQWVNEDREDPLRVLQESDYDIQVRDGGITLNQVIHREDLLEYFTIRDPKAEKADASVMGSVLAGDVRNSRWVNPDAGNDLKLLLMCDSYVDGFINDDLAESFSEVWLVRADYTSNLKEIVEEFEPDMIIYECAERVDRSESICKLAETLP